MKEEARSVIFLTKGLTLRDIMKETTTYYYSIDMKSSIDLMSEDFNCDYYNMIKKLYPNFDVTRDIIEWKNEGERIYTLYINNL